MLAPLEFSVKSPSSFLSYLSTISQNKLQVRVQGSGLYGYKQGCRDHKTTLKPCSPTGLERRTGNAARAAAMSETAATKSSLPNRPCAGFRV